MKAFLPLIVLFMLNRCGNSDTDFSPNDTLTIKTPDSILIASKDTAASTEDYQDTVVTGRFLNLVFYLDSIGFKCDTNRIKKKHTHYSKSPKYNINNHFFYGSTPETSGLYYYFNDYIKNKRLVQEWHLDTLALKNYQRISWYFFSSLKPPTSNDQKRYTDGIIEEWQFKDTAAAKNAAKYIGALAPRLYFNTGAFVCYIDKYMYIMTSGSSGNMWLLRKPVFKVFAERNKATVTNIDTWY